MSPLLVPSYFADLNRFCIPSPIVPGPPPGYTPSSTRRIRFERVRAAHHPAFSNAFALDCALDHRRGRGRNQHRIPRRQLPRRLFFPRQGCEGRLARRNPADLAQRNYFGGTGARALPGARSAHRAPQRRRDWRGSGNRALRIPARRRRKTVAPPAFFSGKTQFCQRDFPWLSPEIGKLFRVFGWLAFSRFLLADCGGGQDKPGILGPSAETPALFFLRIFSSAPPCSRLPFLLFSRFFSSVFSAEFSPT